MKVFILTVLLLCSQPAFAQTGFSTDGIARISCHQWLSDRAVVASSKGSTGFLYVLALDHQEAWLLGYMTGNSQAYSVILHKNVIENGTFNSMLTWIDGYCVEKPNDLLLDAASAYFTRSGAFSIN
jgi:hypothetical protein